MERFQESLKLDLDQEIRADIGRSMLTGMSAKKKDFSKKGLDLAKFDWARVEFSDPRDHRAVKGPCEGHHQVAPFGRGSRSGSNGHGVWLVCQECHLRVMYCPTHGAKGAYRSAGPLGADVKEKILTTPANELLPSQLETHALALEAAEKSAMRKVEEIRRQKQAKGRGKSKTQMSETVDLEASVVIPSKKETKRANAVPAEVQEITGGESGSQPSEGWTTISP